MLVALGYAGWAAGQLEQELAQNAWLTVPANLDILFNLPPEERLPRPCSSWGHFASSRTSPGMPRVGTVLAFDFGLARIGVAAGETETGNAHPLTAIADEVNADRFAAIEALLAEWNQPAWWSACRPTSMAAARHDRPCRQFANQLHGRYGLPVALVDERLTSLEAEARLSETGHKGWRKQKPLLDAVAAQLILLQYFRKCPTCSFLTPNSSSPSSPPRSARTSRPALVGIYSGGVWLAQRLHELLGLSQELGRIDVSFYRDDFSEKGLHPQPQKTVIPFDVEGRHIILVDDVLYTGRTTRAALNELFDYGRPARVDLAVLVDRGGRELPIAATFCGCPGRTAAAGQNPAARARRFRRSSP